MKKGDREKLFDFGGWRGKERRKAPRYLSSALYVLKHHEKMMLAKASNQGPGGAFLETEYELRPGTIILLKVHEPFEKSEPVVLAAVVVRTQDSPKRGVGVKWYRALDPSGLEHLRKFMDRHFHLIVDPQQAAKYTEAELKGAVVYDFKTGKVTPQSYTTFPELEDAERLIGVKLPTNFLPKAEVLDLRVVRRGFSGTPGKMAQEDRMDEMAISAMYRYPSDPATTQTVELEPLSDSDSPKEMSELEKWKLEMKLRKKTKTPVILKYKGMSIPAVVRNVSREAMFALVEGIKPVVGDRVIVVYPVSVGPRSANVIIVGEIRRAARDRSKGQIGIDIKFTSMDEQGQQGIFSEYLMAL